MMRRISDGLSLYLALSLKNMTTFAAAIGIQLLRR
jgi:hypothetical protein